MGVVLIVLLVIAGVAAAIAIPIYLKRQAYIKELQSRGWTFINSPDVLITAGLNLPPFGVGTTRKVDDQITGRAANGSFFQAFQYSTESYSSGSDYVVCIKLPRSLPELYALPQGRPRVGVRALALGGSALTLVGQDPQFAAAVDPLLPAALTRLPASVVPDLSIDHDNLVALTVSKEPAVLAQTIDALAELATALQGPQLASFVGPTPCAELSWYDHPEWIFRPRDDSALDLVQHAGGGQNHRAEAVTIAPAGPLPFIALTHHWQTTRTVTESDGNGGTRTRTETDNHVEQIFEIHPTFAFGEFKLNSGLFGNKRTFEWNEFNERYTVRAPDPRFASDLFHQRMMEFLMANNPPPFGYAHGVLTIQTAHDLASFSQAIAFLTAFFSWVPDFLWTNLGVSPRPVPEASSLPAR